jgi:hypothetical protein
MKSELRVAKHQVVTGAVVVQVWHNGVFIGQVGGADGPGVEVLSKHDLTAFAELGQVSVIEVQIDSGEHFAWVRVPPRSINRRV